MARLTRLSVMAALVFLLSQILLFSLYSCWHNQQEYGRRSLTSMPAIATRVVEYPPLVTFADLVGYSCGYGFYAPRVGSHFITQFQVYHEGSTTPSIHYYPALRTLAARIRYRALLDQFSPLLPVHVRPHGVGLHARRSRAIARSLSERLRERERARSVVCQVGVWYPRPLWQKADKRAHTYVELHHTRSR